MMERKFVNARNEHGWQPMEQLENGCSWEAVKKDGETLSFATKQESAAWCEAHGKLLPTPGWAEVV